MTKRITKTTARKPVIAAAVVAVEDKRTIKLLKGSFEFGGTRGKLYAALRSGMAVGQYVAAAAKLGVVRNKARFELRHLRNAGAVKF